MSLTKAGKDKKWNCHLSAKDAGLYGTFSEQAIQNNVENGVIRNDGIT